MKKILLVSIGMIYSTITLAQDISNQNKVKQMKSEEREEQDFFSSVDLKIFHDRYIIREIMGRLHEQNQNTEKRDNVTSGVFDEKDSTLLEDLMDRKKITYNVTPELLKKSEKYPFETFKEVIQNTRILGITDEEIKKLNQVDKKAISRTLQMITESGPNIGANPVLVEYNETQE